MKKSLFLLAIFALSVTFAFGQGAKGSNDRLWREIDASGLRKSNAERTVVPSAYRTFTLDKTALSNTLRIAPMEFTQAARNNSLTIALPMPDGTLARFTIEESPILEPALAAQHPEIKTYRGQGIDDPTATARFDFTPQGFHSIILSSKGTVLIDPYAINETDNYISYFKSDAAGSKGDFACHFNDDTEIPTSFFNFGIDAPNVVSGTNLRTYRLALAATGEYTQAVGGGTVNGALAAMTTIMNRVNGVYEREVAIRMIIIAGNRSIIYTDPTTDPYSNDDGFAMLAQNQANLDSVIGTANYDIGHVFSTGGGGVASLRSPCNTSLKARGVTGLPNPVGDPFAIDYVAHEMGHQFGANHTFNIGSGSCGAQRSASASYEPGSGVTIMGYAGLCGNQNLALNSIDVFHVRSIEEIVSFSTGAGNACAVSTATGNNIPTVTRTTGFTIPKQTPFALTAVGTDPDGDPLTYDWQQYDLGAPATSIPNSDVDGNPRPLFRPFLPVTGGTRTFPALTHILNSNNIPPTSSGGRLTGELLPSMTRTMIFQVIVRDNRANGSGIRSVASIVDIDGTSGPFNVTAPNTSVTWTGGSSQTVTWDVANTNNATVGAANVKISLSTDGGQTFPTVIAESTPNDGSETITVPNIQTSQARIKIEAVDNIFFDISNANFTINASVIANRTLFDFDGDGKADVSVFRPSNGTWYLNQSTNGFMGMAFGFSTDKIVPADFDGDGKTDVAVYRAGTWYIQRSQLGFTGVQFGAPDDIPVPADYDGDGKADIAVFRPSNGTWYILGSQTGFTGIAFGQAGDKPVAADYDGDGKADVAVYRPSNGTWYIQRSQLGFTGIAFGEEADKPVPADYDGDGKADVAVFRPSNGTWYLNRSQAGFTGVAFGLGTDLAVPADYDGDGKADVAVFREGTWYLLRSQAGFTGVAFGAATDKPIQNSFVR
jgi:hypothetical protein